MLSLFDFLHTIFFFFKDVGSGGVACFFLAEQL